MHSHIQLGDIGVDVVRKGIKNIHLSVHPPTGRVRISAPEHFSLDTIRVFAIAKLGWIREQQRKLGAQEREAPREYLERESHRVWGRRYLLNVVEAQETPSVELSSGRIVLTVRPGWESEQRRKLMEAWYREQVRAAAPKVIAKWERVMGVKVSGVFVQRMKTKWGSCNPKARTIRLNTDLAKKPASCLEYIVVHEMAHIIEPTHNAHFVALMDRFMPKWQHRRALLNRLPVRHENWGY